MNHQISLFPLPGFEADFTPDDWETPDDIAQRMASLIQPDDRRILESAAGRGRLAKYLPSGSFCCEIKPLRVESGRFNAPHCHWLGGDFMIYPFEQLLNKWDLIITNPPFSQCVQFIERGLELLDRENPSARLLYLLPVDFCSSVERGRAFQKLDCHIHHEYRILNRVAYIRDGKPVKGRQIYDGVFDIRPTQLIGAVSFL
jgi:hypothetical protein